MTSWTVKYCHNCWFWEWTGKEFEGRCTLGSVSCNTTILNKDREPPRYLNFRDAFSNKDGGNTDGNIRVR